jgi:zinc/manganese transport system substrate-binding protein
MKTTSFLTILILLVPGVAILRADLKVASLSTVTTDLAREVGGTHVTVESLLRPGTDPHGFEPTTGDVGKVANADLVLLTGKGMEGYLSKLEEAAGGSAKFVDVGRSIPSLRTEEEGKVIEDPHWWHSVANMKTAVRIVAEAFEKADPKDAADYRNNATAYLSRLEELERWIRVQVATLPRDRRKLVTSHDALGYLARDCGFTIYPVKGVSTADDPSSRHVREIVAVIRGQGVKAVFLESGGNPRSLAQISSETGARLGGELYSDGLGAEEARTYESMMRHNVSTIVEGLK